MKEKNISLIQNLKTKVSSERGEIGDSFMTVIALICAALVMFGAPLYYMASQTDTIAQQALQSETTEFVNDVAMQGKITIENYEAFVEKVSINTAMDIEMVVRVADENSGKKATQVVGSKAGESGYIEEQTSQIMDELEENGVKILKKGDYFYVKVTNSSPTLFQMLSNIVYSITGDDNWANMASDGATIYKDGV